MTAWTEREGKAYEVMGCRHRQLPIQGVQFHPESIFTETGHDILRNFLASLHEEGTLNEPRLRSSLYLWPALGSAAWPWPFAPVPLT